MVVPQNFGPKDDEANRYVFGRMQKRIHHATARDLDRALGFAIKHGNDANLIRFVREHSWGLARLRNEEARPVHIPQSRLARQWGVDRSRLAKDLAKLVEDGVFIKAGDSYQINKNVWAWAESRVTHAQKLICIHGEDIGSEPRATTRRDPGHCGAGATMPASRRRSGCGAGATVEPQPCGAGATAASEAVAPPPQPAHAVYETARNSDTVETFLDTSSEGPDGGVADSPNASATDQLIASLIDEARPFVKWADDFFPHRLDRALRLLLAQDVTADMLRWAYGVAHENRVGEKGFIKFITTCIHNERIRQEQRDAEIRALPRPKPAAPIKYFSIHDDKHTEE